jgi:cytochrome c oxidase assembly protein subunit 15
VAVRTERTALVRARARRVGAATFRTLAVATALSLWLIVATGALVRLTASGLGCESWPGCDERSFFPQQSYHGAIEFGNRAFSAIPILLTLVTAVAAWFTSLPRWAATVATATFGGTLLQAPLGLLTIELELHPLMVMTHFLLALVVLAGAVVVAIEARAAEVGEAPSPVPSLVRRLALALVGGCFALVVSGAFVTAAGPHPGDRANIRRLWSIDDSVWVHVRVSAVFGLAVLALVVYLWRRREDAPGVFRGAALLLALFIAQGIVGEIQWRSALPWGVVLVHVVLAAAVWATTVAVATLLWRPPASYVRT